MRRWLPTVLIGTGLLVIAFALFSPLSMRRPTTGTPPPPPPAMPVDELRQAAEPAILAPQVWPAPDTPDCNDAASNTPRCDPIGATLDSLRSADLAYNRVTEMTRGEPVTISLAIAPGRTETQVREAIEGLFGEVTTGESKVSEYMRARLSGAGFTIDPPGEQEKRVFTGVTTRWDWTVTPDRAGEARPLTLDVHAVVALGEDDIASVPVETFRDVIVVRVSVMDRLREAAADSKVLTALGGAAAMLWGGVEFFRRRKWRIEDDEDA